MSSEACIHVPAAQSLDATVDPSRAIPAAIWVPIGRCAVAPAGAPSGAPAIAPVLPSYNRRIAETNGCPNQYVYGTNHGRKARGIV